MAFRGTASQWNGQYPVGTRVRFRAVNNAFCYGVTDSEAESYQDSSNRSYPRVVVIPDDGISVFVPLSEIDFMDSPPVAPSDPASIPGGFRGTASQWNGQYPVGTRVRFRYNGLLKEGFAIQPAQCDNTVGSYPFVVVDSHGHFQVHLADIVYAEISTTAPNERTLPLEERLNMQLERLYGPDGERFRLSVNIPQLRAETDQSDVTLEAPSLASDFDDEEPEDEMEVSEVSEPLGALTAEALEAARATLSSVPAPPSDGTSRVLESLWSTLGIPDAYRNPNIESAVASEVRDRMLGQAGIGVDVPSRTIRDVVINETRREAEREVERVARRNGSMLGDVHARPSRATSRASRSQAEVLTLAVQLANWVFHGGPESVASMKAVAMGILGVTGSPTGPDSHTGRAFARDLVTGGHYRAKGWASGEFDWVYCGAIPNDPFSITIQRVGSDQVSTELAGDHGLVPYDVQSQGKFWHPEHWTEGIGTSDAAVNHLAALMRENVVPINELDMQEASDVQF